MPPTPGPRNAPYPLYGDPRGAHHPFVFPEIVWARPLGGFDSATVLLKWSEPINTIGGLPAGMTCDGQLVTLLQRKMYGSFPRDESITAAEFNQIATPTDDDSPRPGRTVTCPRLPFPTTGYSAGWSRTPAHPDRGNWNYVEGGTAVTGDYVLPSKTLQTLLTTLPRPAARPDFPNWMVYPGYVGPSFYLLTYAPLGWAMLDVAAIGEPIPYAINIVYAGTLVMRDTPAAPHTFTVTSKNALDWVSVNPVGNTGAVMWNWSGGLPANTPLTQTIPADDHGWGEHSIIIQTTYYGESGPDVAGIDLQWNS